MQYFIGIWPDGYLPTDQEVEDGTGAVQHFPSVAGTSGVEHVQSFTSVPEGLYSLDVLAEDAGYYARANSVTVSFSVDLYNGVVTPGTDTATATVDSITDQGTLYMAVRTSGAYGEGDEDDIKNAVGAIYDDSKTPVIGTNTFNVTGLSSETDYHCGFTIETSG